MLLSEDLAAFVIYFAQGDQFNLKSYLTLNLISSPLVLWSSQPAEQNMPYSYILFLIGRCKIHDIIWHNFQFFLQNSFNLSLVLFRHIANFPKCIKILSAIMIKKSSRCQELKLDGVGLVDNRPSNN